MAIVKYTSSQEKANDLLMSGADVFLTGRPGTGKTEFLADFAVKQGVLGKKVLVTASTGIAASCYADGRTLHSALRWKMNPYEYDYDHCAELLNKSDIVIVDEASMLNRNILGLFETCLSYCKRRPQVIVCGDFFQLPPVTGKGYHSPLYPFEMDEWKNLKLTPCLLTEVVRQKDPEFKRMLEKAMFADPSCLWYFNNRTRKQPLEDSIILCTKNEYADFYNEDMVDHLEGDAKTYHAQGDTGHVDFEKTRVKKTLSVKKGMRVMSLANDPSGNYQNGSLGTVMDMEEDTIRVRFDNGNTCDVYRRTYLMDDKVDGQEVKIRQFPLSGGYAITIHKSQGQTFDRINIKAPGCWDPGQIYVALSRATSIEGIHLMLPITKKDLITDQRVVDYYEWLYHEYAA